jgi:hypothetical protein
MKEVSTGDDVAPLIAFDLLRQPVRVGPGSDKDKQGGSWDDLGVPGDGILEDEALEPSFPTTVDDLSVKADANILCCFDLSD